MLLDGPGNWNPGPLQEQPMFLPNEWHPGLFGCSLWGNFYFFILKQGHTKPPWWNLKIHIHPSEVLNLWSSYLPNSREDRPGLPSRSLNHTTSIFLFLNPMTVNCKYITCLSFSFSISGLCLPEPKRTSKSLCRRDCSVWHSFHFWFLVHLVK